MINQKINIYTRYQPILDSSKVCMLVVNWIRREIGYVQHTTHCSIAVYCISPLQDRDAKISFLNKAIDVLGNSDATD